jgi:hypothetical protein
VGIGQIRDGPVHVAFVCFHTIAANVGNGIIRVEFDGLAEVRDGAV